MRAIALIAMLVAAGMVGTWASSAARKPEPTQALSAAEKLCIERGRYLLNYGIRTEEMFVKAMRAGKSMGSGQDLLSPMPRRYVATLTDDDLKAVFVYLRTVQSARNYLTDPLGPDGEPLYE